MLCEPVDVVAMGIAAKAVEILRPDMEAGRPLVVEWAQGNPIVARLLQCQRPADEVGDGHQGFETFEFVAVASHQGEESEFVGEAKWLELADRTLRQRCGWEQHKDQ